MATINSRAFFPRYSIAVFSLCFILMALYYDYPKTLFELPQSIHQWRQADCLSLATNYYEDRNAFLEPSVHYLGQDGTGKTMSEFPLIYYSIAKLWTLTGRNVWVYRSLIALFFFIGLLCLFRMVEREVQNSYAGIFVGLILFTSPVLVYYSNNFLMNIPALSLAMVGLFFFYRYKHSQVQHDLLWCCFFYALAALLKVSSLISFVGITILYAFEFFRIPVSELKGKIKRQSIELVAIVLVLLIPLIWYQYAINFNSKHTGGIFLIGILPIWQMTYPEIKETWRYILIHLRWDYFRPFTELVLLAIALITLFYSRHVEKSSLRLFMLVSLGAIAFSLLFFKALQWHDYYIIDLYILTPILLVSFFTGLRSAVPRFFNSFLFPTLLLALLIHSADFARRRIVERYDINNYQNQHHRDIFQAFSELEPLLKELNISRNDRVLSLSDYSINITLYLMDRKGWTDYGINMDPDRIREKIEDGGAKYLFIADQKAKENPVLTPYLKEQLGSYRNIEIYALTTTKIPSPVPDGK